MNNLFLLARVICFAIIGFESSVSAQDIRTIALRGDLAPGTTRAFNTFHQRSITLGDSGQVAFEAELIAAPASQDTGLWANFGTGLVPIALEGATTPAGNMFALGSSTFPNRPLFVDNDRVGFQDDRFYVTDGTIITPITDSARDVVANNGNVVYRTNAGELVRWRNGSTTEIAAIGEAAPGFAGASFGSLPFPTVNDHGDVASFSQLSPGFVNSIWRTSGGTLTPVAVRGLTAPGFGTPFVDFRYPSINSVGETVFVGTVEGLGDSGVYRENGAVLEAVARTDQLAVGFPVAEAKFRYFATASMNRRGSVAFKAVLKDTGRIESQSESVWVSHQGQLVPIAFELEPAPGTDDGSVFGSSDTGTFFPHISDAGHILFMTTLTDGTRGDRRAIYVMDVNGGLLQQIEPGDAFEVRPGDLRTIAEVNFPRTFLNISNSPQSMGSNADDGRPAAINNAGQFAFWARFTDGSEGVFVSSLEPVPEPSTIVLLGIGGVLLVGRAAIRRRIVNSRSA